MLLYKNSKMGEVMVVLEGASMMSDLSFPVVDSVGDEGHRQHASDIGQEVDEFGLEVFRFEFFIDNLYR